jgi:hypothetical protein
MRRTHAVRRAAPRFTCRIDSRRASHSIASRRSVGARLLLFLLTVPDAVPRGGTADREHGGRGYEVRLADAELAWTQKPWPSPSATLLPR